ncbi:ribonuclease P [Halobacteriales archaeon QS_1_68_20]|nr:MAG: ribonuclease P [Halobacteriales archaeon QS_1_68_20]
MYEAVHAVPDGDSTVSRLALTAADYGFEGVVVRNHGDASAEFDAEAVREAHGVDVVPGIEVRADDPEQASGYLGNYREDHVVLALHGGTTALNRFAVEQDRVDILAHPLAGDGEFDQVMARAAADHGVRVEVDLGRVLRGDGGARVRAISDLERLRTLLEHYDTPFVVSADPTSHLEMRAPRELLAVGETVGFDREQVRAGLAEWGRLAERNRERLSEDFVEPGVWKGKYEE